MLVLDNGSDTIKAGYCLPERDPMLVRRAVLPAGGPAASQAAAPSAP